MPPSLSFKSRAQREMEERERREKEEAQRRERQRLEAERATAARAAEVERQRALVQPTPQASAGRVPQETTNPRPSVQDGRSLVMFEEDGLVPTRREIDDIEMLGPVEETDVVEEHAAEEAVEVAFSRRPPRPPKSPDMRPVYAGFILVFTGLAEFIYGVMAMLGSPSLVTGPWSLQTGWAAFSMGLTASFLGLLAIRGGLWSFRKERFSVVKIGAIAATVCAWAWWVPWLFGLATLVIVTRARDEYYPFYDPRWDAPEWARPPPSDEEEEGEDEEGGGDEAGRRTLQDPTARDYLDNMAPLDDKEASGLQDAEVSSGDGWDDLA